MKTPSARLYCLLARDARVGVVFRRGPTRQVLLIRWNLENDTFQEGEWFKGRIYERRCDLSPKGDKLIYFAATYKEPLFTWTAISKPPWLTAIALWPKGDGWNGGGYFESDDSIVLNHPPEQAKGHDESDTTGIRITAYAPYIGEDDTVHHHLLHRSGWKFIQNVAWEKQPIKPREDLASLLKTYGIDYTPDPFWSEKGFIAEQPEVWCKQHPGGQLSLRMSLHGLGKKNQNWYDLYFAITDQQGGEHSDLGPLDWAEWDSNGDLLFARKGCLFRVKVAEHQLQSEVLIADFNDRTFQVLESPEEARRWQ